MGCFLYLYSIAFFEFSLLGSGLGPNEYNIEHSDITKFFDKDFELGGADRAENLIREFDTDVKPEWNFSFVSYPSYLSVFFYAGYRRTEAGPRTPLVNDLSRYSAAHIFGQARSIRRRRQLRVGITRTERMGSWPVIHSTFGRLRIVATHLTGELELQPTRSMSRSSSTKTSTKLS